MLIKNLIKTEIARTEKGTQIKVNIITKQVYRYNSHTKSPGRVNIFF